MSAAKHTPGHWKASHTRAGFVSWKIAASDGRTVAAITATQRRQPEEKSANAFLLAAAPELLEVVEALVKAADSDPFLAVGFFVEHWANAREALVKAIGYNLPPHCA